MTSAIVDAVIRVAPHAQANYLDAIRQGDQLFQRNGITTPLRIAHFFAQALHETGGFTILRENMNYSAPRLLEIFGVNRHSAAITPPEATVLANHPEAIAERVYGLGNPHKAQELGNTQPGDGFRYRGNGVLQMTGRGAHRKTGLACGVDFEGNPDLATAPEHALKPALQEWTENGLNAFADKNDIRTITLKINGGFNGFAERQALFNQLFPLLRDDASPLEPSQAADADQEIKWLQQTLNTLGAQPRLEIDGRFDTATRQAVVEFQLASRIQVDGIPGPVTVSAIKLALGKLR